MNNLPKAKSFRFVDRHLSTRFHARGHRIDLDKITDAKIEQLLAEDADYWSQKFKPKKKAKNTEETAAETADDLQ